MQGTENCTRKYIYFYNAYIIPNIYIHNLYIVFLYDFNLCYNYIIRKDILKGSLSLVLDPRKCAISL